MPKQLAVQCPGFLITQHAAIRGSELALLVIHSEAEASRQGILNDGSFNDTGYVIALSISGGHRQFAGPLIHARISRNEVHRPAEGVSTEVGGLRPFDDFYPLNVHER